MVEGNKDHLDLRNRPYACDILFDEEEILFSCSLIEKIPVSWVWTSKKTREFMITSKHAVIIEHTEKLTKFRRFGMEEIDGLTRSSTKMTGGMIIHTDKAGKEGMVDHRLKVESYDMANELVKVLKGAMESAELKLQLFKVEGNLKDWTKNVPDDDKKTDLESKICYFPTMSGVWKK